MRLFKVVFLFLLFLVFNSCRKDVTYSKENLAESLEKLLQKESKISSKAFMIGKTLYLDIDMGKAAPQESEQTESVFSKISDGLSAAIRVVISGDSDIEFVIVCAYPQDKSVFIRTIQSIDDFKSYYYMRISMSDFSTRTVLEIGGHSDAVAQIADKRNINIDEFVGRLIVSSIMSNARQNPLFSALISNADLKFISAKNGVLVLHSNIETISESKNALILQLRKETNLYLEKYPLADIKRIVVFRDNNTRLINLEISKE